MDPLKSDRLKRQKLATARAFLSKNKVPTSVNPNNTPLLAPKTLLKRRQTEKTVSTLKPNDRIFTESQLKAIVESLVNRETSKIPLLIREQKPSRDELHSIIKPLIPRIIQPADGKDGKVTQEHIDEITSKILKEVGKTPDVKKAILKVFKDGEIKMENISGLKELKERLDKIADNQKWINRPMGGGYTDADVRRVIDSYGGGGGGSGIVETIVAGTNVTVDSTDPANPIISASIPGGGISEDLAIAYAVAL